MILAEASLAALNTQLPSPMEMERFRPNVVVNGLMAFEEVSLSTWINVPCLYIILKMKRTIIYFK